VNYTRLFSNEQYTMAMHGALLALFGLCVLLIYLDSAYCWYGGRGGLPVGTIHLPSSLTPIIQRYP